MDLAPVVSAGSRHGEAASGGQIIAERGPGHHGDRLGVAVVWRECDGAGVAKSGVFTVASGAGCGCPPRVRTSRKDTCGLMRQPACRRKSFAGFAATRVTGRVPLRALSYPFGRRTSKPVAGCKACLLACT